MRVNIGGIVATMELETGSLAGDLAKVQKRTKDVATEIEQLQQSLKVGATTADVFEVRLEELMTTQDGLRQRAERLTAALHEQTKAHQAAGMAAASAGRAAANVPMPNMGGGGFGKGRGGFGGFNLQSIGYTLDDLQYVGEQGIRPIINNLMQIHPAAGLAALAIDQVVKHSQELATLGEVMQTAWRDAFGPASTEAQMLDGIVGGIKSQVTTLNEALQKTVDTWHTLTHAASRAEKAAVDKFLAVPKDSDVARGKDLGKAIREFGAGKFLDEAVASSATLDDEQSKLLKAKGPEGDAARQSERAYLVGLIDKAAKGDAAAIRGLEATINNLPSAFAINALTSAGKEKGKEADKADEEGRKAAVENQKRLIDETTKGLQKRFNLLAAGGHAPDEVALQLEMRKAGIDPAAAALNANNVRQKLQENYDRMIQDRALQKGMTPEQAAEDLRREEGEKRLKEMRQRMEQSDREQNARVRAGIEDTREGTTGFDQQLRFKAAQAALDIAGMTPEKLQEQIERVLTERGGLDAADAEAGAKGLAKDALQRFGEQATAEAMSPQQMTRFAIQDFAGAEARIQAGVGGDNLPRKQVNLLEMLVQQGAQMLRISGNTVSFQVN